MLVLGRGKFARYWLLIVEEQTKKNDIVNFHTNVGENSRASLRYHPITQLQAGLVKVEHLSLQCFIKSQADGILSIMHNPSSLYRSNTFVSCFIFFWLVGIFSIFKIKVKFPTIEWVVKQILKLFHSREWNHYIL